MKHDYSLVFDTDNEYWQRVLDIFAKNEKYPKKVVSNRNLHHKFPRSFSKMLGEPVDNEPDNLISLSLADHFLVHYYYYLLAKKGFRQRMATAFTFMAKKGLKFMTPETAEQMAEDYAEAVVIANQFNSERQKGISHEGHPHTDEAKLKMSIAIKERFKDPEYRRKNSEIKKGKPHPHKWGEHTEEQLIKLKEQLREIQKSQHTVFGKAYFERYGIKQRDNRTLYQRERNYYLKYGRFSWEDGVDLINHQIHEIEFNKENLNGN